MTFGGDPSLSHQTEKQRVQQWLDQIHIEEQRARNRKALEPVLRRQHFHVAALERIVTVEDDGYRITRTGKVLSLADARTGNGAYAARKRIVAAGHIAEVKECYGVDCYPTEGVAEDMREPGE